MAIDIILFIHTVVYAHIIDIDRISCLNQRLSNEEKKHEVLVLEWIHRQDPAFDKGLNDCLYTDKQITHT